MKFKVGDIITPTDDNPWTKYDPPYCTVGRLYEVIKVNSDYTYIIKNNGKEDGFPHPATTQAPFFVLARDRSGSEFSEEEISKAIEFIES